MSSEQTGTAEWLFSVLQTLHTLCVAAGLIEVISLSFPHCPLCVYTYVCICMHCGCVEHVTLRCSMQGSRLGSHLCAWCYCSIVNGVTGRIMIVDRIRYASSDDLSTVEVSETDVIFHCIEVDRDEITDARTIVQWVPSHHLQTMECISRSTALFTLNCSILDTNFVLINSEHTNQHFIAARVRGHFWIHLPPTTYICYFQCSYFEWRVSQLFPVWHLQVFPSGINQYELQIPGLIIAIIVTGILILLICFCCCVLCCWEWRRCVLVWEEIEDRVHTGWRELIDETVASLYL